MTLQAGTVLIFGIDLAANSYGIVQTYNITENVSRAGATAPDGSVVAIQEYKDEKTLSMTYVPLLLGLDQPEIGTPFEFDDIVWQIDTISDVYVVDGFENVSITAKHYKKIF